MLVLNRKVGEKIQIGHNITITILEIRGNKVRIGIDAPVGVEIRRDGADEQTLAALQANQPFQEQRIGRDLCWWTELGNGQSSA
jgi:carbon storage regulator CsrA